MDKLICSFSGGRTSAYLAYKLQYSPEFADFEKHYVFANTGKELEETLVFVDRCDKEFGLNVVWIEAKFTQEMGVGVSYSIVDFASASRKGEPFNAMIEKFGIPNKNGPFCTKELKSRPIGKWAKDNVGDALLAIGIRADERRRVKFAPNKIYPLVQTWPTSEVMVRNFWSRMPFDLELNDYEGNCDLCFKKSLAKRLTIIKERPDAADQWQRWEENDEDGFVFDRDGFTIAQLVEMSKLPFNMVTDKFEQSKQFASLFGDGIDLYCESKCNCS